MYLRPRTLAEACDVLAGGELCILSGGTDVFPALGDRPAPPAILDLSRLEELAGIREEDGAVRIGGRTSWAAIARARLPARFDALRQAAREVGSIQVQTSGTIAGNLCNASPAADGVPPLLILDAEVELVSRAGVRRLGLPDFILGNRRTARRPDEILSAVIIPPGLEGASSAFLKLGARRYLVISIATAAVAVAVEGGRIAEARIAVGSCSAVARRLRGLEQSLRGMAADGPVEAAVAGDPFAELAPIDDVRASADYRADAARTLVARALRAAVGTR